jgi:hypothetical protein
VARAIADVSNPMLERLHERLDVAGMLLRTTPGTPAQV